MQCSFVREKINEIIGTGGVPKSLVSLAVMTHTLHCVSCRKEWRRLKRLHDLTRNLPAPSLPAPLRARVMAEIQPLPVVPVKKGFNLMRTSLVAGVGVCIVTACLLLVSPRTPKYGAALADETHRALAHVNTFHLKGWKLEDGKKIDWEIWGRHTPVFYHERLGDFETLDTGNDRYLVLAPDPNRFVKSGIIMKLASSKGPADIGWNFADLQNWTTVGKPWARSLTTTTFSVHQSTVMSDKPIETHVLYDFPNAAALPYRYETFFKRYTYLPKTEHGAVDIGLLRDVEAQWTGAQLDIDYNQGIPQEALQIAAHPDYLFIDAVRGANDASVPREYAETKHGLTLQAQPLALDSSGNVVVVVQGWLGNRSFTRHELPFSFRSWLPDPFASVPASVKDTFVPDPENISCRDERGRAYIKAQSTRLPCANGALEMWLLIPREPLAPNAPLPKRMDMTIFGSMEGSVKVGGSDVNTSQELMSDSFHIAASLPKQATAIDFDRLNRLYPGYNMDDSSGFLDIEDSISLSRAEYYESLALTMSAKSPNALAIKKRAVYWMEAALETGQDEALHADWQEKIKKFQAEITVAERGTK
jgi:hypothetical protein